MNRCLRYFFAVLAASYALASPAFCLDKIILLAAEGVSLSELMSGKQGGKIVSEGTVGVISPNVRGSLTPASVTLTISAGTGMRHCRAESVYEAGETTDDGDTAADAYMIRMWNPVPPEGGVCLNMGAVITENEKVSRGAPGALGDSLRKAGFATCAVGNSDLYPDKTDRSFALIACDAKGVCDYAFLADDKTFFEPARTPEYLFDKIAKGAEKADFIVADFGDAVRIEDFKKNLRTGTYEAYKKQAAENLDKLIGLILADPATKDAGLIVLSQSPKPLWDKSESLGPIVFYNIFGEPGLATSATTRTPGVVAAADIAPTVCALFGADMIYPKQGRVISSVPGSPAAALKLTRGERVRRISANILLWFIAASFFALFVYGVICLAFDIKIFPKGLAFIRDFYLFDVCLTGSMLLSPLFGKSVLSEVAFSLIAALVVAYFCVAFFKKSASRLAAAYGFVCALCLVDAFRGGVLCRFAPPSFYFHTGLRFYGMGNEYAALLIAFSALTLMLLTLTGRKVGRLALVLSAVAAVAIGFGAFGANNGAAVTAVVLLSLVSLSLIKGGFRKLAVPAAFGAAIVIVAGLAAADMAASGGSPSHAGAAAALIKSGSLSAPLAIISRKVLYNLSLLGSTGSVIVLSVFALPVFLWLWKVTGKVRNFLKPSPAVNAAVKGYLWGVAASFVFNDSGCVMAALLLGALAGTLICLMAEKQCRG